MKKEKRLTESALHSYSVHACCVEVGVDVNTSNTLAAHSRNNEWQAPV